MKMDGVEFIDKFLIFFFKKLKLSPGPARTPKHVGSCHIAARPTPCNAEPGWTPGAAQGCNCVTGTGPSRDAPPFIVAFGPGLASCGLARSVMDALRV